MSQLFWEQSKHWEELSVAHINNINALCASFIKAALNEVVFDDVSGKLQAMSLDTAVEQRRLNAQEELVQLIHDKQRQPITYDSSYTANVQEARSQKTTAKIQAMINQAQVEVDSDKLINAQLLANGLKELTEPDMDKVSAEDALDSQLAYYKVVLYLRIAKNLQDKVRYFITAVTDQVIERHLLHNLAQDTLSPLMINDMADREVEFLAAEAEEVTHKRAYLEGHKAILESGQDAFRDAMASYK